TLLFCWSIVFWPTAEPITIAARTNASQPKIASLRWLALHRPMRAATFREGCVADIAYLSVLPQRGTEEQWSYLRGRPRDAAWPWAALRAMEEPGIWGVGITGL